MIENIHNILSKARLLGVLSEIEDGVYYIHKPDGHDVLYIEPKVSKLKYKSLTDAIRFRTNIPYYEQWCTHLNVFGGSGLSTTERLFEDIKLDVLDLTEFDTSNVENMIGMFYESTIGKIIFGNFNTHNVYYMQDMFANCDSDNLDLSSFDTSNVKTMSNMFMEYKYEKFDISNFCTKNVIDMDGMFSTCGVKNLDLSHFDTSNVVSMKDMFMCCSADTIDVSSFDTSKVTNMRSMFYMVKLDKLDLSDFNTSRVYTMKEMFTGSTINELDISSFDTSRVESFARMFCSFTTRKLDVSHFSVARLSGDDGLIQMFDAIDADYVQLGYFGKRTMSKAIAANMYGYSIRNMYIDNMKVRDDR